MYDETQAIIADYLLRYRGIPLAILEAKAESTSAADGMQQASRYARRLLIRFSFASNGHDWILTDNETGDFETFSGLACVLGDTIPQETQGFDFKGPFDRK